MHQKSLKALFYTLLQLYCHVLCFARDLDRERQKLEQQEKKVIADIKKMAKAGQMVSFNN